MNHSFLRNVMPSVVDATSPARLENNGNNEETSHLPVASANIVADESAKQIPKDLANLATLPISMHLAPCTKYVVVMAKVAHPWP